MIALTIFLLVESEKENSEYNLFLDYLPKSLEDHPLFFKDEKKINYIKGSCLHFKFKSWKEKLQSEYESLLKINVEDFFKIKEFTFEKYIFFRALVWSRNFHTQIKLEKNENSEIDPKKKPS